MLKLYFAKGSSALASHLLLEEVGADYTAHEISIQSGAHKEGAYRAINPKMRVPALETAEGIITENPAILNYVAATHPASGVLPDTSFGRAQADAFNAYLCATMHVAFAHKLRGARWADTEQAREDMAAKVPANLRDCAQLIEAHYLKGPWILGDQYTTCDAYMILVPQWLSKAGVDINEFPKLAAHRDALMSRPATQTVMAAHDL
ncbi:glutathione S-transferase family protein [Marivita hallyeonensis]|uniref:Glutathione S-transferase n=1 Tax=Marivita hallyeonensis TaxID=996342 RepID=A0A1M5PJQ3_9RHOB|nr:glutathione S-transferase family protein [Marivita hallyeonensis]SHH02066.1 glutathione S-transferase [Marivita hallyeonensis]